MKKEITNGVKSSEKNIFSRFLFIIGVLFGILFLTSFASASVNFTQPADFANFTGSVVFNVTFLNDTDMGINVSTTLINITIHRINSTVGVLNASTLIANATLNTSGSAGSCARYAGTGAAACNFTFTLTSSIDGLNNLTIQIANATTVVNTTINATGIRFDSTVPAVVNNGTGATNRTVTLLSASYINFSTAYVLLNISVRDLGIGVQSVRANVTNGTGASNFTVVINLTNMQSNITNGYWVGNITFVGNFTEDIYNITIWANDTLNNLNNSVTIRDVRYDITVPQVNASNFTSPKLELNRSTMLDLNISAIDTATSIGAVMFQIINVTGGVNGTFFATQLAGAAWNVTINTTSFPDGNYSINVTVNDTAGNQNASARISNFRIDNTKPTVTATLSSLSATSIAFTVASSDTGTGINSAMTCNNNRSAATRSGTGTSQTFTETGLSCSTSYSYLVKCEDYAFNNGSVTFTYTTSACSDVGTGGGGGGGGSTGTVTNPSDVQWTKTYAADDADLSTKGTITQALGAQEQVQIKIASVTHHVGVVSVATDSNSATIEVGGPQTVALSVGASKMFDVNSDNYYDLQVTLVSITNGKANLTITPVRVLVPASEQPAAGNETGAEPTAPTTGTGGKAGVKALTWIIIAIIIIAVIAIIIAYQKRRR